MDGPEVLTRGIQPGTIVLLHDAICRSQQAVPQYNREPMLEALTLFLDGLGGRSSFVTIPELLRHGHPQRYNWDVQAMPARLAWRMLKKANGRKRK
jgi:hypothetical protein